MSTPGRLALVGSGEYTPEMREAEAALLAAGPSNRYVQLATAAGRESASRISYWEELGANQAAHLGAEHVGLKVYTREDAMNEELAAQIEGVGLIYLSGGDPHYLAEVLLGTPVWAAIERNWRAGSSLAGCSAGAMAMCADIPNFRKMSAEGSEGLALVPHLRVIPHYNKFFKWIPDSAAQMFLKAPAGVTIVGVDEDTLMQSDDQVNWTVVGKSAVHVLNGANSGKYVDGQSFTL